MSVQHQKANWGKGRHGWAAAPCSAFSATSSAANLQCFERGLSRLHVFLPPSRRSALTTALPSQDGISALGTCGPHTFPWVTVRSSKTAAALQDCPLGLGGLGLGDTGLAARSWFRRCASPHASPSQDNKHCKPVVWRPRCRSGKMCVGTGTGWREGAEEGGRRRGRRWNGRSRIENDIYEMVGKGQIWLSFLGKS